MPAVLPLLKTFFVRIIFAMAFRCFVVFVRILSMSSNLFLFSERLTSLILGEEPEVTESQVKWVGWLLNTTLPKNILHGVSRLRIIILMQASPQFIWSLASNCVSQSHQYFNITFLIHCLPFSITDTQFLRWIPGRGSSSVDDLPSSNFLCHTKTVARLKAFSP